MVIPAPPGMQPWIREMERRVSAAERGLKAQDRTTARTRRTALSDTAVDAVTTPYLDAPNWKMVAGAVGPVISGEGNGERVKLTVTAVCEGLRSNLLVASAGGIMRASLQALDTYMTSTVADDEGGHGFQVSFSYPNGAGLPQRFAGSFSRILNLPVGPYTVRSEYLYTQLGTNIAIRWSQRELTIEPF